MGNFAVSTNRTVKLVDAEQVLVVDLTESNVTGRFANGHVVFII